jgi:hypothetical protein
MECLLVGKMFVASLAPMRPALDIPLDHAANVKVVLVVCAPANYLQLRPNCNPFPDFRSSRPMGKNQ